MVIITMNTLALSNYTFVLNCFPLSIGDSFKWKERMKEKPNSLFDRQFVSLHILDNYHY